MNPVGSTSWHNRHLANFKTLNELLVREGREVLTVLLIGPGAVTVAAAPFLNDAEASRPGRLRKLVGDAARYADQLLRRIPFMPLRSLEPAEVESALTVPHRLVVADCSIRVLEAVRRRMPGVECHYLDIAVRPLPLTADVVIAFNVICRLNDPAAGMAHVAQAVRPGGWLLMDDRSAAAHLAAYSGFESAAPKIHRRMG